MDKEKENLLHILSRDIKDRKVLEAIKDVPREEFIPNDLKECAYINKPLGIGYKQTISQPYIVALMCELLELKDTDTVLDIGTGSGYQAAVLSKLCKEVISIEIVPELANRSKLLLKDLGYTNITVIQGNGREGYSKRAPYNKIICAAVTESIPNAWKDQLVDNGIIVLPLYIDNREVLVRVRKKNNRFVRELFDSVLFVSLVKN